MTVMMTMMGDQAKLYWLGREREEKNKTKRSSTSNKKKTFSRVSLPLLFSPTHDFI